MPKYRIIPAIATAIVFSVLLRARAQDGLQAPVRPGGGPAPAAKAAEVNEPPTEAELFLDEAIKKVAEIKSVSADVFQTVSMLDQKFEITGRYLKAPGDRLLLDLSVSGMPDSSGKMRQVCDGITLWDYQQVFESRAYRKLDAAAILKKLRTSDLDEKMKEGAIESMGFAGPDILLVGLRRTIKFDQGPVKTTLDGRPVIRLAGVWKSREGLMGPDSRPLPMTAPLPSYIPSLVKLYLGADDSWPYQVELVGQPSSALLDTRPVGPDGRKIGSKSLIQKPLLTRIKLVYKNVKLNTPIANGEFVFSAPPDAQVEDSTKAILDGLEQAATMRAAQKKAESSQGGGELLNQGIDIPKATPPPAALPSTPAPAPAPAPTSR